MTKRIYTLIQKKEFTKGTGVGEWVDKVRLRETLAPDDVEALNKFFGNAFTRLTNDVRERNP